jgi:Organic radical activating enzymes
MPSQLHHLITLACNKACPYCINELKEFGDSQNRRHASLEAISAEYSRLSAEHDSIKISGGEPTKLKRFQEISRLASDYFADMELVTANTDIFTESFRWIDDFYNRVYFTLHEPYLSEFCDGGDLGNFSLVNRGGTPVVLTCMTDFFERLVTACGGSVETLLQRMLANGFHGITVRQEWPDGKPLSRLLPSYANFSTRYNLKQQCESQVLLMPDLSTIDNRAEVAPAKVMPWADQRRA